MRVGRGAHGVNPEQHRVANGPCRPAYSTTPPLPYNQTNYLTEQTKHDTLWDLPRDSSSEKVTGLFNAYNDLFDEMQHQYTLRKYSLLSWMVSSLPTMSTVAFVIALVINALLLVSVSVAPRVPGTPCVIVCVCTHVLFSWMIFHCLSQVCTGLVAHADDQHIFSLTRSVCVCRPCSLSPPTSPTPSSPLRVTSPPQTRRVRRVPTPPATPRTLPVL